MYVQVYLEHCCDIDIRIVYCIMMNTPHTRHAYITYKMMKNYRKIKKNPNIQQTEIYLHFVLLPKPSSNRLNQTESKRCLPMKNYIRYGLNPT